MGYLPLIIGLAILFGGSGYVIYYLLGRPRLQEMKARDEPAAIRFTYKILFLGAMAGVALTIWVLYSAGLITMPSLANEQRNSATEEPLEQYENDSPGQVAQEATTNNMTKIPTQIGVIQEEKNENPKTREYTLPMDGKNNMIISLCIKKEGGKGWKVVTLSIADTQTVVRDKYANDTVEEPVLWLYKQPGWFSSADPIYLRESWSATLDQVFAELECKSRNPWPEYIRADHWSEATDRTYRWGSDAVKKMAAALDVVRSLEVEK